MSRVLVILTVVLAAILTQAHGVFSVAANTSAEQAWCGGVDSLANVAEAAEPCCTGCESMRSAANDDCCCCEPASPVPQEPPVAPYVPPAAPKTWLIAMVAQPIQMSFAHSTGEHKPFVQPRPMHVIARSTRLAMLNVRTV